MAGSSKKILGGNERVKVCLAQVSPVYLNRDASVDRAVGLIAEAAANGASLIVFPEVWLAGYPFWTEGWDSKLGEWAQSRARFFDQSVLVPSAATEKIGEAARRAGIHVVIGCNEIDPRAGVHTIYNSLLFFDRFGRLMGRHRKLMPTFTERLFWGHGDGQDLAVYDTEIGRIGALICGENLMTPVRAAMIAMGEDFHIAVFPGSFALHTGPRLEEWDSSGNFWGHFVTRAHAFEAGAFVLSVSGYIDKADIPDDFAHKDQMNIAYALGGSQVVSPLGVPLVGPLEGSQLIYAECEAWMIKAVKAIVDTLGHYARPDVARIIVNRRNRWECAGEPYASGMEPLDRDRLLRASEEWAVPIEQVEEVADLKQLSIAK